MKRLKIKNKNRTSNAGCFVKWIGKIDKVTFCNAK